MNKCKTYCEVVRELQKRSHKQRKRELPRLAKATKERHGL